MAVDWIMSDIPEEFRAEVEKWRNFPREHPQNVISPAPGQESVWDYPRPPLVEASIRHIRVYFTDILVADSRRTKRVLETAGPPVYYIPQEDIQMAYLEPALNRALCEWKGFSQYWIVHVGESIVLNAAWSYPEPWKGYESIQDNIAFNATMMSACYVDDMEVVPQPGEYYGGWITPEIVGPFKGIPGSERW
jgi:uncharacterized protein (DUF427 family)